MWNSERQQEKDSESTVTHHGLCFGCVSDVTLPELPETKMSLLAWGRRYPGLVGASYFQALGVELSCRKLHSRNARDMSRLDLFLSLNLYDFLPFGDHQRFHTLTKLLQPWIFLLGQIQQLPNLVSCWQLQKAETHLRWFLGQFHLCLRRSIVLMPSTFWVSDTSTVRGWILDLHSNDDSGVDLLAVQQWHQETLAHLFTAEGCWKCWKTLSKV